MRDCRAGLEALPLRAVVLDLGGLVCLLRSEFQDTNRFALADRTSLSRWKWRGLAERWLGLLASRQALGSDGWSVYRGTARVPAKQFECFSIRLGNRGGL